MIEFQSPGWLFFANGEWVGADESLLLLSIIILAATGTGILLLASIAAYRRRRTREYFLVTLAIGALFARSIVGIGTVHGLVPMFFHHLLEHTLDFLIAVVVLYAIYLTGVQDVPADTSDL